MNAPAGVLPLMPGDGGDDTAAIQAAIDAVAALPLDERGMRGAVELGPGTFTIGGSLKLVQSGVVLRGHGSEPTSGTVLRGVGTPRALIQVGPKGVKRKSGGRETYPISDVYVPVGARSFTLAHVRDLKPGDDIIVHRPKTQRWICAIGTDVLPSRKDGLATPPWKASGMLTFERRIVRIDGNRVVVDAPLTNALEREFTQAYVTKLEFPERIAEVGVEHLSGRWETPVGVQCPTGKEDFIQVNSVQNAWVKNVRGAGLRRRGGDAGLAVQVGDRRGRHLRRARRGQVPRPVGVQGRRPAEPGAARPGHRLVHHRAVHRHRGRRSERRGRLPGGRQRAAGARGLALVDRHPVRQRAHPGRQRPAGRGLRPGPRAGRPTAGRRSTRCVWNSEAEVFSVDDPPTAHNWIMGGASKAKALLGTGTYSAQRASVQPQSLYRAQLAERLGRIR